MKNRKKRCLSKPCHALLCVLAMALILVLVRLLCGPSKILTEGIARRLAQRRALREPAAPTAQTDFQNWQVFAVWDGEAVQTYFSLWTRPGRRGSSYNADGEKGFRLMADPLLKEYEWCRIWSDSRDFGWGCPGYKLSGYVFEEDAFEIRECVPLAVINEDPAAASGVLTVSGRVCDDGENGSGRREYAWTTAAVREDPHFFLFELSPKRTQGDDISDRVLAAVTLGEDVNGLGTTAAAVVVWYDKDGSELYRQEFDLLKPAASAEGSEENGA